MILAVLALIAWQTGGTGGSQEKFLPFTKHHDFEIGALASVGGGAPVYACCGSICGPGLDNANEILAGVVEVPRDWDGASSMSFHIHTTVTDSDPIATTEDVDIDWEYRSVALTETGKTEPAVTGTDTYLQSGAGTECDIIEFDIAVPYNTGNQPLTTSDDIVFFMNRNPGGEANSYSGAVIPYKVELVYTSDKLPSH